MNEALLTIRNLTCTDFVLTTVEQYESPKPIGSHGAFAHFTRNITSLTSNYTYAPTQQLAAKRPNYERHDVKLTIRAFETRNIADLKSQRPSSDILRLTFLAADQQYRIDVPTPSTESQTLIPLTTTPTHSFTAIFNTTSRHLTLFSSSRLDSWMSNLPDSTPLSALSIPGTHNSHTYHRALPSVRCQAVPLPPQLLNGIRFLDIRLQPASPSSPSNATLLLVHGVFAASLSGPKPFRPLLTHLLSFLSSHPSETLLLSLKREGPGPATDAHLSRILHTHYISPDPSLFYTHPRIPTLGAARGKIVILRRFALDPALAAQYDAQGGWCLDAEQWAYNTPNDTRGAVCVQDFCEVLETVNIDAKARYCQQHLERAAACVAPVPGVTTDARYPVPPGPLYLNFLSASNFWRVGCWPERIAARLNPEMVRFLCERFCVGREGEGRRRMEGDGQTGVVVCDWVGKGGDWDLVRCIVGMNARLEMREREWGIVE